MKAASLTFLLVIAIFAAGCARKSPDASISEADREFIGEYSSTDSSACDLRISVSAKKGVLEYSSGARSGKIGIIRDGESVYLKFIALTEESPKGDVEALYEGGKLYIQNEGNSINPYTIFPQYDVKFIELQKDGAPQRPSDEEQSAAAFEFGQEVTLSGTLYQIPLEEGSTQMPAWILDLGREITIISNTPDVDSQELVQEIQVDFPEDKIDPSKYESKSVKIKGRLNPSQTIHDHRPVVLSDPVVIG